MHLVGSNPAVHLFSGDLSYSDHQFYVNAIKTEVGSEINLNVFDSE